METPQTHTKSDLAKQIQTVFLSIITAALIGFFVKINDINDRLIRIEERAITNTENINTCQQALNRIQMEQQRASDRMTRLELQFGMKEKQ